MKMGLGAGEGGQSMSEHFGKKEKSLNPAAIRKPDHPVAF
jgi:hypothetical protein